MAAPFDSDDMMKRSLFGAIFGFKKNSSSNSASVSRSRASSIDHPEQPGPSWAHAHHVPASAPLHASVVPSHPPIPSSSTPHHPPPSDYFPSYPHHSFPGQQPPLPVLTTQCPYSRQHVSYSSLAHQTQAPAHIPSSFPHPPPPPPPPSATPGAPYAYGYASAPPPPPYTPYPPHAAQQHATHADYYKTKADIYREIVNECEEFERSTTNTPHVESSPATPTVNSPLINQWCAQPPQHQPIHEITANFSMMDLPPTGVSYHSLDHQRVASLVQQQIDVKPILGDKDAMEALVRLVVQAVKDTGTISNGVVNSQSPEEILKRKRQMNNEAAARYRKRQREEKDKQHTELDSLEQRNLDLKRTVDDMEREIEVLKKYVLEQSRQAIVAKVEDA